MDEGISENITQHAKEEEAKENPLLRDVIIGSTFAPNRAIADNIQRIDLGELNDEADQLMALTASLPNKEEAAKILYVTPNGKLLIQKKPLIGSEREIRAKLPININGGMHVLKRDRQDKFIGTIMHTHGIIDTTPSDQDLINILLEDKDLAANTATFVVTQTQKILVFRSPRTPEISRNNAAGELMKGRLRARTFLLGTHPDIENFAAQELDQRFNMHLFRDMVERYQLSVFTAMGKETVLRKQTA